MMIKNSCTRRLSRSIGAVAAVVVLAAGCGGSDEGTDTNAAAVSTYAEGVHASYTASLASAEALDAAVDALVEDATTESLTTARDAWIEARDDYGPTEAFRFYGGPIDDVETGTEGLINAWPLDEAYIDYVEGSPDTGIINDAVGYPEITTELLISLNESGGEANISTGWHAIEFLLWGQDLSAEGPGDRPVEDFVDSPNADRRATYLVTATDLLVDHLSELVDAWAPDADNYRKEFLALPTDEAMVHIFTGIGELSRGELAGERMNVAYSERSQEDEHSCFSDNTTADLIGNARGIEMVLTASYPGVEGTSILDAVAEVDSELADRVRDEVSASRAALEAIPAPFDQWLADGVSDTEPGREAILTGIQALGVQADGIVAAADALGLAINVS